MRLSMMLCAVLLVVCLLPAGAQTGPATPTASQTPVGGTVPPLSALTPPGTTGVTGTTETTQPTALPAKVVLPDNVANHAIVPRDTLQIISWTVSQVVVNTVLTVGPDGSATLPYAGTYNVNGVKIGDLQTALAPIYQQRFPGSTLYLALANEKTATSIGAPATGVAPTPTTTLVSLLTTPFSPRDQLYIRVYTGDLVHLEVTVTVSDTLSISLPPLGPVVVKGLTLQTLSSYLLARYRLYYPRSSVDVLLITHEGQPVNAAQLTPPPATVVPDWQKFPPDVTATAILTSLPRFGAAVFGQTTPTGTNPQEPLRPLTAGLPLTNPAVPADYLLGPGDQLAIRNWTGPIEHYNGQVPVAPEGSIYLPLLGELSLTGQTLSQATNLVAQRFAKFFRGSQTTVTIVAPRNVEVYVTGDATSPGKYTLSGTATVFTALYAAGGPSPIGSLRDIRLTRKGQPDKIIDLYGYLLTGDRNADVALNPGDNIFIAPAAATIGVAGLVRRPSLYEITAGLSITDALKMAAGLDPRGYGPNVEVWRVDKNTDWNVININLNGAQGDKQGPDFKLQSGDLVLVRPVLERPANTVEVIGAVRRPGTYEVGQGLDVASLIKRAQGLEDSAYVDQGAVWRLTPNHDYKMLRFNVAAALAAKQPDNLLLLPSDKLYIYSRDEVIQTQQVSIAGAVAGPGVFPWAQDMRVSDLLLNARGLLPGAYTERADLQRLTPDRRQEIIPVQLTKLLSLDPQADLTLQPGDNLIVYSQADLGVTAQVTVSGNVQRPGAYERKAGMKASDLIYQAGGLLPGSGEDIEYTKGRTAGAPQVTHLKLNQAAGNFSVDPDVVLADDDNIAIMGTGDFQVRPQLVTIQGEVAKPGTYALLSTPQEPDTVYKLLERSGLCLPSANPRGIVLYRPQDATTAKSQTDDVSQVLKAFNRESVGTKPSLSANAQADAMSGSLTQQFSQMFGGANGEAVVVVPPRTLDSNVWANAVPIEGEKLLSTKGKEGDMPLAPGDTVVVPKLQTTVSVIGAVVRPGAIRWEGPQSPQEYVTRAGGPAADAVMNRIVVIRANGAALPLNKAPQVQAGDVIVVPSDYMVRQLGGPSTFQRILQTIATIAAARIVVR